MRLAFFVSGGGSNMQAILDAIATGTLDATPAVVVSDRPSIGALNRAERHGLPAAIVRPRDYAPLADGTAPNGTFGQALLEVLRGYQVDTVALAGYLRHIPSVVVRAYRHRMLNVHPSLLPAFGGPGMYGHRVHQAVLDHGDKWSGASVHFVDEDYDTGPIILQAPVPVAPGDTASTLAARVLKKEHQLFPEALRLLATDRLRIYGRRVEVIEEHAR
ncbi:MAG: phosphoribosylglycinamide formyltransferase [Bacteroidota bacterium]